MRNRRGQTLVVFAMTLFLLTVMVMITLGVASRVKERMEQQTVADTAAYSQAILTARTFNSVAMLNRALISQLSSLAAAQSLISFAGFYHGTLNQARDVLGALSATSTQCSDEFSAARTRITTEDAELIEIWEPPNCIRGGEGTAGFDRYSADFIRDNIYGGALKMAREQREIYADMRGKLYDGEVAKRVVQLARGGQPWGDDDLYVKNSGFAETEREVTGVDVPRQEDPKKQRHMVRAVMAARGVERFVSSREADPRVPGSESGAEYVKRRIEHVIGAVPLDVNVRHQGSSWFGDRAPMTGDGTDADDGTHGGDTLDKDHFGYWRDVDNNSINPDWTLTVGADVGRFSFEYTGSEGCSANMDEDSFGYVRTGNKTHGGNHTDHMWRRGYSIDYQEKGGESCEPPIVRHRFDQIANSGNEVSIWPVFVDFNEDLLDDTDKAAGEDDDNDPKYSAAHNADGMPKNHVVVFRDYDGRGNSDPWNVEKTFRFSNGETINLKQNRGGFNISVALSTGLTYYHRGEPNPGTIGSAREPPNFLSPFWRATLSAGDVDEKYGIRGRSAARTLDDVGLAGKADVLRDLRGVGFEAMP